MEWLYLHSMYPPSFCFAVFFSFCRKAYSHSFRLWLCHDQWNGHQLLHLLSLSAVRCSLLVCAHRDMMLTASSSLSMYSYTCLRNVKAFVQERERDHLWLFCKRGCPSMGECCTHSGKCIAMMYQRDIKSDHAALTIWGAESKREAPHRNFVNG